MNLERNLKDKKQKKKRRSNFLYDFVKITGLIPTLILMRPKFFHPYGKKRYYKGGILAACNHVDFLDPVVLLLTFWYRRVHSVATNELFSNKQKAFFFSHIHCIPIDKKNFTVTSLREIVNRLKAGHLVTIFPEGTVVKDVATQHELAYKSGVILMALKSKTPVLPIYVGDVKKWYSRRIIVMGEPIDFCSLYENPTKADIHEMTNILRQKEIELMDYYEEHYASKKRKKPGEDKK